MATCSIRAPMILVAMAVACASGQKGSPRDVSDGPPTVGDSAGGGGGTTPTGGTGGGQPLVDAAPASASGDDARAQISDALAADSGRLPDGPAPSNGPARIVLVAGGGNGADGTPATEAKVANPYGTVVDESTGDIYIAEVGGARVRRIDTKGVIETVLGAGAKAPADVSLNQPHDLLFQPGTRNLFVADTMNHRIYRMDVATGAVALFAGAGTQVGATGEIVYCLAFSPTGDRLYFIAGPQITIVNLQTMAVDKIAYGGARVIAIDSKGIFYAVKGNGKVLQIVNPSGEATDVAETSGKLNAPKRIAIDRDDNVVIADTESAIIRRFSVTARTLESIAGTGVVGTGVLGADPGKAQLKRPHGVFVDGHGVIYISDSENNRVLRIEH